MGGAGKRPRAPRRLTARSVPSDPRPPARSEPGSCDPAACEPPGVVYAVGDVHGRAHELRRLVDRIKAHARRRRVARPAVVFLGDYVDRGPDSAGVLDLLSSPELHAMFHPVLLMGNHDRQMLLAWGNLIGGEYLLEWLVGWGGAETVASYGIATWHRRVPDVMAEFRAAVPRQHIEFLAGLSLCHRVGRLFFCHAGVAPGVALDRQTAETLLFGVGGVFLRYRGDYGARIVHGHFASPAVDIRRNRINVDSSAGHPLARLSAVAIAGEDVEVIEAW